MIFILRMNLDFFFILVQSQHFVTKKIQTFKIVLQINEILSFLMNTWISFWYLLIN